MFLFVFKLSYSCNSLIVLSLQTLNLFLGQAFRRSQGFNLSFCSVNLLPGFINQMFSLVLLVFQFLIQGIEILSFFFLLGNNPFGFFQ